ncbi:hypothetical protein RJ640_004253 [Escallonia rubra]|uniref:Integrase catalytic domain-containing protein n=1 Tax=Escallonia rubra TaxID=112253 RepID=A0AA88UN81_9ASTE|nr:hypothetical protein RJ640_004253 [Escallonia rubra]
MVQGLPTIEEKHEVCEGFAFGKHHRQPFPKEVAWRAKEKLELVRTDVCGLMQTLSNAENGYFILFIDGYTRMTWVYFMRQKSEVFGVFRKFKCLVEKQSGCFIRVLIRSDKGKEYTSNEFHNFCEDERLERQITVDYTPQQNGVSERKNQTVIEMAKSMLHDKGIPRSFWAEAVHTAEDNKVEKQGIPFDDLQENSTQEDENDEDSPPNTPRADSLSSLSSSPSSTPRRMRNKKGILIVAIYVDDLLFTGNSEKMIKDFRKEMMKKLEEQMADIFTKALPKERFQELRQALGVQQQDINGKNIPMLAHQETYNY